MMLSGAIPSSTQAIVARILQEDKSALKLRVRISQEVTCHDDNQIRLTSRWHLLVRQLEWGRRTEPLRRSQL